MLGGASYKSMLYLFVDYFKPLEQSLSIIYNLGSFTLEFNILFILRNESRKVVACLFLLDWLVSHYCQSHAQPSHISFHGLTYVEVSCNVTKSFLLVLNDIIVVPNLYVFIFSILA